MAMANWYSNHFGADGDGDTAAAHPNIVVPVGIGHARVRIKSASITVTDTAATDVLRMFTMKSSDRLWALYTQTDGGFSASNSAEVGLFTVNDTHTGAVLDVDLFGAGQDYTSALDTLTEIFTSGALTGISRMKHMWEIYKVGAGTDTVDPQVKYEFGITLQGNDDATSSTATLTAVYTAGD
jgi:hypothetical protein